MTEKQFLRWQRAMGFCRKVFRCHQLSDRSFIVKGVQLPLCARCTGIVIGFCLIGPIASIITLGNMFVSVALILLMCLDGVLQLKNIILSTNLRRVITGLGCGYGLFSIVLHSILNFIALFK